ncbi:MAG: hypothetical protein ACRDGV_04545 [Candidatus Limnocylindria bacterium]
MSFNRRNPGNRGPDRFDRGSRPPDGRGRPPGSGSGDWRPRDRGDRPDRGPRPDRDRSFGPRRPDHFGDEGGMSITLDPRRLGSLKQLAGEAGVRPGELVRRWVEERIDAARRGDRAVPAPAGGRDPLLVRFEELAARVAALESSVATAPEAPRRPGRRPRRAETAERAEASETAETPGTPTAGAAPAARRGRQAKKPAKKGSERVALHDEMIAVIGERGPSTAAELAEAIAQRGRYAPPRSGKALDAATVSARVSNPTYRGRFTRSEGRIGLSDAG